MEHFEVKKEENSENSWKLFFQREEESENIITAFFLAQVDHWFILNRLKKHAIRNAISLLQGYLYTSAIHFSLSTCPIWVVLKDGQMETLQLDHFKRHNTAHFSDSFRVEL